MQNWGFLREDYRGMVYNDKYIPAENDIPGKMKPAWGKLYYPDGNLLYEGFMVDQMAYGAGTSYHPAGYRCQEGLWGPNGLICGREYYNNGQIRFEGTYQYNPGFKENWPVFGAWYDARGNLKYYGAFDVIGEEGNAIRPFVMKPENYGPVMHPLFVRLGNYRFKGEEAWKYYTQEDPEFKNKKYKAEKEKQRTICSREKTLKRLREGLTSLYPEIRAIAEQELRQMGEWTDEDAEKVKDTAKHAETIGRTMTPLERYERDLRLLAVPRDTVLEDLAKLKGKTKEEKEQLLTRFAGIYESLYPYKHSRDPRYSQIGRRLEHLGINTENWIWRLDEMTDMEIFYMAEQEPGVGSLNEGRLVYPESTDRERIEFMRNFGG